MEAVVELAAALGGGAVGLVLWALAVRWIGAGDDPSVWQRLLIFALTMVMLLVGYLVVVQARCAVGWLPEDECPAWG